MFLRISDDLMIGTEHIQSVRFWSNPDRACVVIKTPHEDYDNGKERGLYGNLFVEGEQALSLRKFCQRYSHDPATARL
jgi:hypothetical protein